jgi:O-acetyl-ADP-ribose deacetylase (regulator of RNase III)
LFCIDVQIGGCAYLNPDDRYVFYLVTKERYFHKPTMSSLESSLRAMRDLCKQNEVHHLAMPRIGCGLDKLDWNQVSRLIQRIFEEDDIEITIYTI